MNIVLDYPAWIYAVCILVGIVFSFLLYRKEKTLSSLGKPLFYSLISLRFLLGFLLALMLFNPQVFIRKKNIEKPIIAVLVDNSQSILANADSAFLKNDFLNELSQFKSALSDKFSVESFTFGEKLKASDSIVFIEKTTDISQALTSLNDRFYNQNLSAVVLVTDGIYNQGNNPVFENYSNTAKIYSIALGDTSVKKDIAISNVKYNNVAFLGNKFPINVSAKAFYYKGKTVQLSVYKSDELLQSKTLTISSDNFFHDELLMLEATSVGVAKYSVKISQLEGEYTYKNNLFDVFVDVINSKQNILLLANAPHPDMAALRSVLSKHPNYSVDVYYGYDFKATQKKYDAVVFHNLPSKTNYPEVEKLLLSKVSKLFITGTSTNYNALQNFSIGLQTVNSFTEAGFYIHPSFSLFEPNTNQKNAIELPPLKSPFVTNYSLNTQNVLMYQKIGNNKTNVPLVGFYIHNDAKVAYILGEGIWRWKLVEHQRTNANEFFDGFVQKTFQYLSIKEDKSLFRVALAKNTFQENEQVLIRAELYNKTYELINTPDVSLTLTSSKGETFNYQFSKTDKSYSLNLGNLPPADYSYEATTTFNNERFVKQGAFTVTALQKEQLNIQANHDLLSQLAHKYGGAVFYPTQLQELKNSLLDEDSFPAIIRYEESTEPIINLLWILGFLLLIVTIEWFLRKRNGTY